MKRRDFLKGLLGSLAGLGASVAGVQSQTAAEISSLPELITEMPRTTGIQYATYADNTTTQNIIAGETFSSGQALYIANDGKAYKYRNDSGTFPMGIALDEHTMLVNGRISYRK